DQHVRLADRADGQRLGHAQGRRRLLVLGHRFGQFRQLPVQLRVIVGEFLLLFIVAVVRLGLEDGRDVRRQLAPFRFRQLLLPFLLGGGQLLLLVGRDRRLQLRGLAVERGLLAAVRLHLARQRGGNVHFHVAVEEGAELVVVALRQRVVLVVVALG